MNDITARTEDEMLIDVFLMKHWRSPVAHRRNRVTSLLVLALAYLSVRVDRRQRMALANSTAAKLTSVGCADAATVQR
jgi:hypothetical protein